MSIFNVFIEQFDNFSNTHDNIYGNKHDIKQTVCKKGLNFMFSLNDILIVCTLV